MINAEELKQRIRTVLDLAPEKIEEGLTALFKEILAVLDNGASPLYENAKIILKMIQGSEDANWGKGFFGKIKPAQCAKPLLECGIRFNDAAKLLIEETGYCFIEFIKELPEDIHPNFAQLGECAKELGIKLNDLEESYELETWDIDFSSRAELFRSSGMDANGACLMLSWVPDAKNTEVMRALMDAGYGLSQVMGAMVRYNISRDWGHAVLLALSLKNITLSDIVTALKEQGEAIDLDKLDSDLTFRDVDLETKVWILYQLIYSGRSS